MKMDGSYKIKFKIETWSGIYVTLNCQFLIKKYNVHVFMYFKSGTLSTILERIKSLLWSFSLCRDAFHWHLFRIKFKLHHRKCKQRSWAGKILKRSRFLRNCTCFFIHVAYYWNCINPRIGANIAKGLWFGYNYYRAIWWRASKDFKSENIF